MSIKIATFNAEKDTYTAAIKAKLATLVNKYLYAKVPKGGRPGDCVGFFDLVRGDLSGDEVAP